MNGMKRMGLMTILARAVLAAFVLWPAGAAEGQIRMDVSVRLPDKSGKRPAERPQTGYMSSDARTYYPGRNDRSWTDMLDAHFPAVRYAGGMVYIRSQCCLYYLVDGMPVGSLDAVDPLSVCSVSVLADVAHTSIYGPRGRNGVVSVQTCASSR